MQRLRLAQNILILQALDETPVPPSENSLDDYAASHISNRTRVLSLVHERRLVEILTYWASSSGNPRKVIALCVEEYESRQGMTIRLAVNHGDLNHVKAGFNAMKVTLQQVAASNDTPPDRYAEMLRRQMVDMNHNRILARLRSRHAELEGFKKLKSSRPKVALRLMELVESLPLTSLTLTVEKRQDLLHDTRAFCDLFSTLEALREDQAKSMKGLDVLLLMTKQAQHISTQFPLEELLSSLPGIDRGSCAMLCRTMTKLGYYSTIPDELVQAASKHTIFSSISIEVARYAPDVASGNTSNLAGRRGAEERVQRAIDIKTALLGTESLGTPVLSAHINRYRELQTQLNHLDCSRYPVHAEMQLLTYYELHPSALLPRVISSSKKACYLCNLFFSYHGKFFIPNSHGRTYEKWALPRAFCQLKSARAAYIRTVTRRFNEYIERATVIALESGWKRVREHPNESLILKSAIWSIASKIPKQASSYVTLKGVLIGAASMQSNKDASILSTGPGSKNLKGPSKRTASESSSRRTVRNSKATTRGSDASTVASKASTSRLIHSLHSLRESFRSRSLTGLTGNKTLSTFLSSTKPTNCVGTPGIQLLLSSDSPASSALRYSIDIQLMPRHAQRTESVPAIVDVNTMMEGEDILIEGNSFVITRHNDAILIEYAVDS
ncbi:hypothetical protein MMC18_009655 [Xylographa bjoerkii]|nr:hypothetical protein [Xylographa bjoerkii]